MSERCRHGFRRQKLEPEKRSDGQRLGDDVTVNDYCICHHRGTNAKKEDRITHRRQVWTFRFVARVVKARTQSKTECPLDDLAAMKVEISALLRGSRLQITLLIWRIKWRILHWTRQHGESNSKHWFTTSLLWRKVPESDARSVTESISSSRDSETER